MKIFTRKIHKAENGLFCGVCEKKKKEKYCKFCKKDTLDHHVMKVEPLRIRFQFNKSTGIIKRGKESVGYFLTAFCILWALVTLIISMSDIDFCVKFLAIIVVTLLLGYLCFFGNGTRNWIVGFVNKILNHEEKF